MHRGYTLLWRKIWSNPLLSDPGKKFSRLEAWLYLINVLATGKDDEASGLMRGEFEASSRYLAGRWNWPRTTVQRFLKELETAGMITRVSCLGHHSGQTVGQHEGRFTVQNYETYNPVRATERAGNRATSRANIKEVIKESIKELEKKDTRMPSGDGERVPPRTLVDIYREQNQSLPEVKALTAERLRKCRSRIDQAVRDGCLEQYLEDFKQAVKKAQQTPFLRGEGSRGWRASFDWFVSNHVNAYAVLEGKYDGQPAEAGNGNGGSNAGSGDYFDCGPGETSARRTSRGDPIYRPRQ